MAVYITGDGSGSAVKGAASTIVSADLAVNKALVSDASGKVAVSNVSSTELGYLSGVTSAVQTQINGKQASVTGAATTITSTNLTANRAVVSSGSGKVSVSTVTSTELGYLSGVTSAVQTQLNGKQGSITISDTDLTPGVSSLTSGQFYAYYE